MNLKSEIKNFLKKIPRIIPDKPYLKLLYYYRLHKKLNLKNPVTYNEKLQWLKLYDRNPAYVNMVDKYEAKEYVKSVLGEQYIIPTYGVWSNFDDIDFNKLPEQFVLKCTHDSGGVFIVTDKAHFDKKTIREKINKSLKNNYYWAKREWPYKDIKPRIIAEKYMVDESGCELKDYKFFCFNGVPKAMFIATDRYNESEETKFDFYDMDFNHLPFENGHPNSSIELKCPTGFHEMQNLAKKLSMNIPQVRIDFYDINGRIYFGEITLFHWSGLKPFKPEKWDKIFGDWIELPRK